MLRTIIFDFNGIILDDEPLHFQSMRDVLSSFGISIAKEEYWERYLPFDDVQCLDAICRDHSLRLTSAQQQQLLKDKSELYHQMLQDQFPIFPGAAEFVRAAANKYPLAIASGARADDIERTLQATKLKNCFRVVVAAEDFHRGKPHPESYLLALDRLNAQFDGHPPLIRPHECLVVEDSIGGVHGARAAGMVCLAVSNTYPPERLQGAHAVVTSLQGLDVEYLSTLFEERT